MTSLAVLPTALLLCALPVGVAIAQQPPPATEAGAHQLALPNLVAGGGSALQVTSPAFPTGGDIPFANTQYRGNVFPGLQWSAGPAGTKSYAVIMQDGDGIVDGAPVLHWTLVDVPPTVTTLDPGMSAPPAGARYGPNIAGRNRPYAGPRTPAGPRHRYHFQVFALDTTIPPDALASYAALTGAMKGHVLAAGETIGLGRMPTPADTSH